MAYLLDTNVISDLVRNPNGVAAASLDRVGDDSVFTSIIVAGELRFGARKKGSAPLTDRVERALKRIRVASLDQPADRYYAEIRYELLRRGQPIGTNDFLIAAHALATESILVTANVSEFSRVPGLHIENWLTD